MNIVLNTSKYFSLLTLLVLGAACSSQADPATQIESDAIEGAKPCTTKACFSTEFADCKSATYTTDSYAGSVARYHILGPVEDRCQVQMSYATNPNPMWQGKSLTILLDTEKPFEWQMKEAIRSCLTNDTPGKYQCDGTLHGIAVSGGGQAGVAATGNPCGEAVDVAGEPLHPLRQLAFVAAPAAR